MIVRRPYTPRPYQPLMIDHILEHKRCALWVDMGLGKTLSTLTALDYASVTDDVYPILVIGPLRVARDVWPKECEKWEHLAHLACVPIVGDIKQRTRAVRYDSPIYSINYECLAWLLEYWGRDNWPYKTVIADESTKLKGYRGSYRTHPKTGKVFLQGAGGVRARALGTVAHEKVSRFIELTGTPSPNGLVDLWGQAWYLDAGARLGRTFEGFKQRWFHAKYNGFGVDPNKGAEEEIHEKLRDLCLSIDAKDYFDLEQPVVSNVFVDLPPDSRRLYKEMEKDMFIRLADATAEAFGAAAKTQKCLQLASGAVYVDPTVQNDSQPGAKQWRAVHEAKLEALASIVEEANGAALMISYEFRSDLARILAAHPTAVDLGTTEGMRAFKAGESLIGVGHPASIGHGVDGLQDVCHRIVFFGHNWSLELYQQILGRIGPVRQLQAGFTRPVFVYNILAADTVDELVVERREGKRSVQEILLEAMKRRVAE